MVQTGRSGRRVSAPASQAGETMYRNSFVFFSKTTAVVDELLLLRVGGRGTQPHPSSAHGPCWLLSQSPTSSCLSFCLFLLLYVGTPGPLLCWVSRVNLRACGQRLIEECVDIVLGFGVPRTVSFHIRDGCCLFQLLFLSSLQSAVSPTVFLVAEARGMWMLIGTIDDRVVRRTSWRTRRHCGHHKPHDRIRQSLYSIS